MYIYMYVYIYTNQYIYIYTNIYIYIYIYYLYIYILICWYMNIRISLTILDLDISIIFIGTEGFDPAAWRSSSCCLAWWNRWNHGTSKEDDHKCYFTSFPMEMMVFTRIKYNISIGIPWNFHWNTMKHLETSVFQWNLGKWTMSFPEIRQNSCASSIPNSYRIRGDPSRIPLHLSSWASRFKRLFNASVSTSGWLDWSILNSWDFNGKVGQESAVENAPTKCLSNP